MQRIVATLDRMDRLEGSLVIFQGDHGFHAKESDLTDIREPMPRAVRARLSELRDSYDPDAMLQRSHALLLVHQPGASGPLRVDMRRSQLVDIAPTVAKVAGLKPWRGVGISLFRPDDPERPWHFFAGITRKHGLFRKRLGRDTDQGRIAHISVDGRGGWIVHPDIVAAGPGRIPGR